MSLPHTANNQCCYANYLPPLKFNNIGIVNSCAVDSTSNINNINNIYLNGT